MGTQQQTVFWTTSQLLLHGGLNSRLCFGQPPNSYFMGTQQQTVFWTTSQLLLHGDSTADCVLDNLPTPTSWGLNSRLCFGQPPNSYFMGTQQQTVFWTTSQLLLHGDSTADCVLDNLPTPTSWGLNSRLCFGQPPNSYFMGTQQQTVFWTTSQLLLHGDSTADCVLDNLPTPTSWGLNSRLCFGQPPNSYFMGTQQQTVFWTTSQLLLHGDSTADCVLDNLPTPTSWGLNSRLCFGQPPNSYFMGTQQQTVFWTTSQLLLHGDSTADCVLDNLPTPTSWGLNSRLCFGQPPNSYFMGTQQQTVFWTTSQLLLHGDSTADCVLDNLPTPTSWGLNSRLVFWTTSQLLLHGDSTADCVLDNLPTPTSWGLNSRLCFGQPPNSYFMGTQQQTVFGQPPNSYFMGTQQQTVFWTTSQLLLHGDSTADCALDNLPTPTSWGLNSRLCLDNLPTPTSWGLNSRLCFGQPPNSYFMGTQQQTVFWTTSQLLLHGDSTADCVLDNLPTPTSCGLNSRLCFGQPPNSYFMGAQQQTVFWTTSQLLLHGDSTADCVLDNLPTPTSWNSRLCFGQPPNSYFMGTQQQTVFWTTSQLLLHGDSTADCVLDNLPTPTSWGLNSRLCFGQPPNSYFMGTQQQTMFWTTSQLLLHGGSTADCVLDNLPTPTSWGLNSRLCFGQPPNSYFMGAQQQTVFWTTSQLLLHGDSTADCVLDNLPTPTSWGLNSRLCFGQPPNSYFMGTQQQTVFWTTSQLLLHGDSTADCVLDNLPTPTSWGLNNRLCFGQPPNSYFMGTQQQTVFWTTSQLLLHGDSTADCVLDNLPTPTSWGLNSRLCVGQPPNSYFMGTQQQTVFWTTSQLLLHGDSTADCVLDNLPTPTSWGLNSRLCFGQPPNSYFMGTQQQTVFWTTSQLLLHGDSTADCVLDNLPTPTSWGLNSRLCFGQPPNSYFMGTQQQTVFWTTSQLLLHGDSTADCALDNLPTPTSWGLNSRLCFGQPPNSYFMGTQQQTVFRTTSQLLLHGDSTADCVLDNLPTPTSWGLNSRLCFGQPPNSYFMGTQQQTVFWTTSQLLLHGDSTADCVLNNLPTPTSWGLNSRVCFGQPPNSYFMGTQQQTVFWTTSQLLLHGDSTADCVLDNLPAPTSWGLNSRLCFGQPPNSYFMGTQQQTVFWTTSQLLLHGDSTADCVLDNLPTPTSWGLNSRLCFGQPPNSSFMGTQQQTVFGQPPNSYFMGTQQQTVFWTTSQLLLHGDSTADCVLDNLPTPPSWGLNSRLCFGQPPNSYFMGTQQQTVFGQPPNSYFMGTQQQTVFWTTSQLLLHGDSTADCVLDNLPTPTS